MKSGVQWNEWDVLGDEDVHNAFASVLSGVSRSWATNMGLKLVHVTDVDVASVSEAIGDGYKGGFRYLGGLVADDQRGFIKHIFEDCIL